MKDIVICVCQHEGEILLLKRAPLKPEPFRWTAPSGKRDEGESLKQAALRELFEETSIKLSEGDSLEEKGNFVYHYPKASVHLHLYYSQFTNRPDVILNEEEHVEYRWIAPKEALLLPLMEGADQCLNRVLSLGT